MRPGAEAKMRDQIGALSRVYDLLLERTSTQVAEVEELLESFA